METAEPDGGRKLRGLEIAARCKVIRQGQGLDCAVAVERHQVHRDRATDRDVEAARCSCPDYEHAW